MALPESVSVSELVALLAPTIGEEKSLEVVRQAMLELRMEGEVFSVRAGRALLNHLLAESGVVGIAARFARQRLAEEAIVPRSPSQAAMAVILSTSSQSVPPPPPTPSPRSEPAGRPIGEIVALLAATLGSEKAWEVVRAAAAKAGVTGEQATPDQTAAILDTIGESEGLQGVAARFAKARLILRRTK